jgi:PII-like signaling protein
MKTTTPSRFPGRPAKRLTLLITVRDHVRHTSLERELLKRARKAGLAGLTVFEGTEGFGASGHVHREHLLSDDRPLALVIIDEPEKIDAFLEEVRPLLTDVVVTVTEVEVLDL